MRRFFKGMQNGWLCPGSAQPLIGVIQNSHALWAWVAVVLLAVSSGAQAQKNMALVIGNSNYTHESKLANPVNDAQLIARTLRGLGFTVEEKNNLAKRDMELAIARFVRESAGADAAVLYYAGHGSQPVNGGRNYLLPVDAKVDGDDTLDTDGIAADRIVEQMERSANPAKLRLVVLDACRNNRLAGKARSGVRGLARMTPSDDYTLIAFSTNDQEVALDGSGAHSPYAQALAGHLARARELPVRRIFELTASDVRAATNQKQRPRTYGDLDSRALLSGALLASLVPEPVRPAPPPAPVPAPAPAAQALRPGSAVQDCIDCPEMLVIPAGRFTMGSPANEVGREADEGPQRSVNVASFLLGKTEVTVAQFKRFTQAKNYQTEAERNVGASGCYAWDASDSKFDWRAGRSWRNPGWTIKDNEPVTCVSYNDAMAYVQWMSQTTGQPYQLPSEAQWEYAARAGTTASRYWGDNPNEACRYANGTDQTKGPGNQGWNNKHECNDGHFFVAPVGNYQANAFGLHDMLGNVLEWTQDCFHDNYNGAPTNGSAWTTNCSGTERRVLRGGSWSNSPAVLRSAYRGHSTPGNRDLFTGFRVSRTLLTP